MRNTAENEIICILIFQVRFVRSLYLTPPREQRGNHSGYYWKAFRNTYEHLNGARGGTLWKTGRFEGDECRLPVADDDDWLHLHNRSFRSPLFTLGSHHRRKRVNEERAPY